MASINTVILIGNVVAEPELRNFKTGTPVLNFKIATNEKWKDKDGKEKQSTEYHKVVVIGRGAEGLSGFLAKGMSVYVEGKINTREYEKDGVKKYMTEIMSRVVQVLTPKPGSFQKDTTAERLEMPEANMLPSSFDESQIPF